MDTLHARADWESVGDRWFRKTQQYTKVFDQDLDLDNYVVAGAPYAGALALWRDETKILAHQPGASSKPSIDIYSLAGKKIRAIPWDRGAVKGLGWSDDESLLVVTADGNVRCYDLQGDFSSFSLGHGADNYGVESCRFYNNGMVALLGNNTFVTVSSYAEPRPRPLAKAPEGEIHSWAIISPDHTLSRSVELLLSLGSTVFILDAVDCEDRMVDFGPFTHISVSPDGRYANLYGVNGQARVISSDFQDILFVHDSDSRTPPKYVEWCGSDALIAWEDEVHIIGPGNQSSSYIYDSTRVHVVSEYDGARLITNDYCEFLERVPDDTLQVFGHASESSPASILLDAVGQLEIESPKADDYIQLIRPNLTEAVDTCVNAAGREFDTKWQKRLLKAASFGKSVLDIYNSDDFVDMCETLRVLNAVRDHQVGMPLSFEQYHRLTPEKLVQRLLNRHDYLLALKIAGYLKLPSDRIYVHWACSKVRIGDEDDDTICRVVVDRLSGKPGISFEEIARAAYHEGRGRLATELLNHEPRGGRQVPLLLDMEEDELALDKSIESGDTDLVLYVLLKLKKKLPLAAFFRVINARPTATAMVEASAIQEADNTLLKDLYYQDDRRVDGALVFIRESLNQPDARTASDKLALAAKLLADTKEANLELHALNQTTMLLRLQAAFDRDLTDTFSGLSVDETLFKLIRLGYNSQAKKIQNDFKVPEKVAWWIRLRALVAKREWNEIEDTSKQRKSPIGWEPFFNLTLQAGNPRLAAVFIPKCTGLEPGETIIMYEKCGMRVRAAEEAVRLRDQGAWQRLLEAAGRGSQEGREIERLGATVFSKK
ncbi:Vacuolar protein sorting-associated protein 16 [Purpureocillium takamizusanense]|uniref:Probable vacuolar protein sorting-associated protein 16 homolog n=1 Tax=Purpureocillium takamizusanense TaxID=2060973 RepID=A0A9Q8V929_9HYPO|nr:Vacuolar protein sorting-associated protein 16 [Purpureocillium takamizusanense]UNI16382.1 Vacuolar protein sorting-associated protein 16 [Purpureocillium takamizusanense]